MSKQITHFWIGNFKNEKVFNDFFEEQYIDDESAVSKFAKSQNETWIDHDFLETEFKEEINYLGYSYASSWVDELKIIISKAELKQINALVMLSNDRDYSQVNSPKSYKNNDLELEYLGIIEYSF